MRDNLSRQRELEVDMRQRGFARAVSKMGDKYSERDFKGLIGPYIEGLTGALAEETLKYLNLGGGVHLGVRRLLPIDPEKSAAITLDCALAALCRKTTFLKLALQIGRCIEAQHKLEAYESYDEKKFSWLYQEAVKRATTKARLRYKLIHGMTEDHVPYSHWTKEEALSVGFFCIDVLVRETGLVELHREYNRRRSTTYVVATEVAHELMTDMVANKISSLTQYGPLICPPRPWQVRGGRWTGGYYLDSIQIPLVKTKSKAFQERLPEIPMASHVAATNHLQNCPYAIDQESLGLVSYLVENRLETKALPLARREVLPYTGTTPLELVAWKREAREAHEYNQQLDSKYLQVCQVVSTAYEYLKEPEIFFAINCDFRGRLNYFTGPSLLNPQSNDLTKSLIRFAHGESIKGAEDWFMLHGANEYGVKGTKDERVAWVWDNSDYIMASALRPLEFTWWQEADSPLVFLRWCREYLAWQQDPDNFLSYLPCHLDGTCNGIQHLAALTRDSRAASAVNMLPGDRPQDMYTIVSEAVREKFSGFTDLIDIEFAIMWAQFGWDRNLVKRQCMTKAYGSTLHSCTAYTREYVRDRLDSGSRDPFGDFKGPAVVWMSKLIWESINETVRGPQDTMEWLQTLARAYNSKGLPMEWESPSGFTIHHFYPEWKSRQIRTYVDGQEVKPRVREEDHSKICEHEVVNGISANFIHSLDAAHLVAVVNRLAAAGVTSILTIHDSYGVHARHAALLDRVLREEFVRMYTENDPLGGLVKRAATDSITAPALPAQGDLDLSLVLDAPFFFS